MQREKERADLARLRRGKSLYRNNVLIALLAECGVPIRDPSTLTLRKVIVSGPTVGGRW